MNSCSVATLVGDVKPFMLRVAILSESIYSSEGEGGGRGRVVLSVRFYLLLAERLWFCSAFVPVVVHCSFPASFFFDFGRF